MKLAKAVDFLTICSIFMEEKFLMLMCAGRSELNAVPSTKILTDEKIDTLLHLLTLLHVNL